MSDHLSKILLVEDSEEDFITIQRAFSKANVKNKIDRVQTGDEAIEYLKNNPLPNLILLDLNLPGIDGREVLKRLKSDEKYKKMPIIILTTSGDEKDVESCYDDGANSYMQKPVNFASFVEAISRLKDYWFEISILPRS